MQLAKLYLRLQRGTEQVGTALGAAPPLQLSQFCLAAQLFAFLGCVNWEYRQGPGNLLEGRVFTKLSALYTGTCICLMISISVIERAVKKHRESDGGYQDY